MKNLLLLTIIQLSMYTIFAQQEVTFEAQTLDTEVAIGYGLAIGDVDGDGDKDILMADKKEFVWYRNPDWERFVMVENLTDRDNVCIAAEDINGDGQVEVAVGAQWNPGETSDAEASGSVHYLQRPDDPTQKWSYKELPHVPTIHRMRWVKTGEDEFQLIVLPLHGIGNQGGEGEGVQVLAYSLPGGDQESWSYEVIDSTMHMTHNFDAITRGNQTTLFVGGKEGIQPIVSQPTSWIKDAQRWEWGQGFGEVRIGYGPKGRTFVAGIEPMHGNILSVYWIWERTPVRQELASDLNQGHALACADLLGMGSEQIVVGWRNPNDEGKVGIRLYALQSDGSWNMHTIDDNEMACEDLKLADLNGDDKLDIIACGRATNNLTIYWNKN